MTNTRSCGVLDTNDSVNGKVQVGQTQEEEPPIQKAHEELKATKQEEFGGKTEFMLNHKKQLGREACRVEGGFGGNPEVLVLMRTFLLC